MSDDITTMRVVIGGQVQGVGFRDFVCREASGLGLNGWVRNRRDGTVEAVISGDDRKVKDLIQKCTRGPASARVTHIDLEKTNPPAEQGFSPRPTL